MFYRFTLAAVVAATALTGCAAFKPASTTTTATESTQSSEAPAAEQQPAASTPQESQSPPEQPVQQQPITAPGAITESGDSAAKQPDTGDKANGAAAEAPSEANASAETAAANSTQPAVEAPAASAEAAKDDKITAAEGTKAIPPFSSGPTQIDVSHVVTRADDGSAIILTIDGTEAGTLKRGEKRAVFVEPGKHKVGGYVQTLFGMGRVTIPAVEITTEPGKVKNVAYSVTKTRPTFAETKDTSNAPG